MSGHISQTPEGLATLGGNAGLYDYKVDGIGGRIGYVLFVGKGQNARILFISVRYERSYPKHFLVIWLC
jgi:hypothetical protein